MGTVCGVAGWMELRRWVLKRREASGDAGDSAVSER